MSGFFHFVCCPKVIEVYASYNYEDPKTYNHRAYHHVNNNNNSM